MAKSKADPEAGIKAGVPDAAPKKTFQVSLPHAPTRRVEAADHSEAWEVYKAEVGLISTVHEREVKEVADAADEAPAQE